MNGPAVCSFSAFRQVIFSHSLAIPRFKLLSHVSSLQLPSGHSGLVLTLSNAACSSPFRPHLLVADEGVRRTFLLGVAFRHVSCGFYLFLLPVRLPSEIQKLPQTHQCEGFLVFGNFLYYMTPFPGRVFIPNSFVCLFIFYILSYLFSKTMAAFLGV